MLQFQVHVLKSFKKAFAYFGGRFGDAIEPRKPDEAHVYPIHVSTGRSDVVHSTQALNNAMLVRTFN